MRKVKAKWVMRLSEEKGVTLVEAGKTVEKGEVIIQAEIKTPVSGQVVEVTAERVVIEFKAFEFEGEGITTKKAWGEGIVGVSKLTELTKETKGKVIYMEPIDQAMVLKAEVVGVAAILITKRGEYETRMPIVYLDSGAMTSLLAMDKINERQVLVNANVGRVLVV